MDLQERRNPYEESLRVLNQASLSRVWTALPGLIESFDAAKMTAVVQPALQGRQRAKDGSTAWVNMPLLVDCPVVFPSGGGCSLTFPIKKGDECLVLFGARCIDAWWQSGGVQPQAEIRMHSLSDGFVLVGVRSQPNVLTSISTSAVELRSDDHATRMALDPASQTVSIVAPGGVTVTGDLTVSGTIKGQTDVLSGPSAISGKSHKHTGVSTGAGTSGGPTN